MSRSNIKAGGSYVELLLKNNKFMKGLAASGKKLAAFAKGAALAGTAIAAAGISGAAAGVRGFLKFGDELDKMSKRTGVSVEALSELKHAAELSGTSAETLEKGFAGLSRSLFDAGRGSAEAVDALKAIGLSAKDLNDLSPEKQMNLVADGLSKIANESTRGAVAQKLFGRAGRQLLPMLRDGSKGMESMRQAARDAGLTMSTETAEAAARLTDMFGTLWSTIKMVFVNIGATVAPTLEAIIPVVQEFASSTSMAVQGMGDTVDSVMTGMQDVIFGVLNAVSFAFQNWGLIVRVAGTSALFSIVRFVNQAEYLFTGVLWPVIKFIGASFKASFTNMVNIVAVTSANIWKNLKNLWDSIMGLFKGEGFSFEWTPLTEGFEAAIIEMPKIAEREIGPMEAQLKKDLQSLANEMVTGFDSHTKKFEAKIEERKKLLAESLKTPKTPVVGGEDIESGQKDAKDKKGKIFGAFSLAAIAAQGGGKDKTEKAIEKADKEQAKRDKLLLDAVRGAGVLGA